MTFEPEITTIGHISPNGRTNFAVSVLQGMIDRGELNHVRVMSFDLESRPSMAGLMTACMIYDEVSHLYAPDAVNLPAKPDWKKSVLERQADKPSWVPSSLLMNLLSRT